MKRKKILVLSIGLAVAMATLVATIVITCLEIDRERRALPPNASGVDSLGLHAIPATWFLFLLPIVFVELMLLMSVYRLMFRDPKGRAKVCSIIAAALTASVLLFEALVYTGVVSYDTLPWDRMTEQSYYVFYKFFILWPVVLATFILNLVPSPKKKEALPDDSAA